jgi:hypothetical protein
MAGLVPAIHGCSFGKVVDARDEPGMTIALEFAVTPGVTWFLTTSRHSGRIRRRIAA